MFDFCRNAFLINCAGESKENRNWTAVYHVRRTMGTFGNVSVMWKIVPENSNDVEPKEGVLNFLERETEVVFLCNSFDLSDSRGSNWSILNKWRNKIVVVRLEPTTDYYCHSVVFQPTRPRVPNDYGCFRALISTDANYHKIPLQCPFCNW